MPLWHCTECHHEWEGQSDSNKCDWCNARGEIIAEQTELEKMVSEMIRRPQKEGD